MKREPIGSLGYEVKQLPPDIVTSMILPFELKTNPFDHQNRSLVIGIDQPSWLFALDMGTGKSKLSLDLITIHKQLEGCQQALICAPPIVLRHWKKQVALHSHLSVTIVEGSAEQKRFLLENATTDIVVVSQPWIVTLFGKATKEALKKDMRLNNWLVKVFAKFDILIIDEVHTLKSSSSVGWKGFKKYALDIPFRYFMTGTPIGNNYVGIYALYYLIDKGATFGSSYAGFISTWFDTFMVNGRFPRYTLKPKKREEFMKKFWSKMIRWEEKECNSLPPKSYVRLPVMMTIEQERLYDSLVQEAKDEERDISFDLMRVTAGCGMAESPKLDTLLELIEEVCINNEQQLIVWHWLEDEGKLIEDAVRKRFKKLRFAAMRGSISKKEIDANMELWHKKKIDLVSANVKSIGIGVDMYEANKAIYFSNNRSIIDRMQSEKRIHRTGQTRHCTYYDLIVEGTIDQVNLEILDRAKSSFTQATGDGIVDIEPSPEMEAEMDQILSKEQLTRIAYKE